MKIGVLGSGLRTPLLLHGLIHSGLRIDEIALYDSDSRHSELMAQIGSQLARRSGPDIRAVSGVERAAEGAAFVISAVRVGNMETRALDERLALECGFAGQETTGPAGFAMALRTIPVVLEHARIIERVAPLAWLINFTNPAGLITQAISTQTSVKIVGICDTPAELFFQIARALGEPMDEVQCSYFGLNHLGWVYSVQVRGHERIHRLLEDDRLLRQLYPVDLFPSALIRTLSLIPTEYLFFYYNPALARDNQRRAGATRGEELSILNRQVMTDLHKYMAAGDAEGLLQAYIRYVNRRNASYMKLDAAGRSAFEEPEPNWNPFEGATGYHRIAVSAIQALAGETPRDVLLNVANQGTVQGLAPEDVIEAPCQVDQSGPRPRPIGILPERVRGLIFPVKEYERLTIEAAVQHRRDIATLALTVNPIVGCWQAANQFLERLIQRDQLHFAKFR